MAENENKEEELSVRLSRSELGKLVYNLSEKSKPTVKKKKKKNAKPQYPNNLQPEALWLKERLDKLAAIIKGKATNPFVTVPIDLVKEYNHNMLRLNNITDHE